MSHMNEVRTSSSAAGPIGRLYFKTEAEQIAVRGLLLSRALRSVKAFLPPIKSPYVVSYNGMSVERGLPEW